MSWDDVSLLLLAGVMLYAIVRPTKERRLVLTVLGALAGTVAIILMMLVGTT